MLFHANVFRAMACFEHSNFFKVTTPTPEGWQLRHPTVPGRKERAPSAHRNGGPDTLTQNPTTSFLTATT